MANQPIELVPCKLFQIPTNSLVSSIGNSNAEIGSEWSSILTVDLNSSDVEPFIRPVTIQPPDSLITNPIYLALTIGSFLGNLAMLGLILFTPQFRKPANYLIVNLSLSSILFILSANLRLIENAYELWSYSTFRCGLLAVIHRIPVPCLALTTMIISLDRGRVARNPMTSAASASPTWKIIFIWGFSLIIVVPLAFTREYDECIPMAYKCAKVLLFKRSSFSVAYGIAYLMSVHIVPAVILIRESVKTQKIMKFLKQSNVDHVHHGLQSENTPYPTLPDNRLRLLRNSCIFTTIFLIFWLPYGIFQFPLDLPKEILPELLEIYVRFYFKFVRNIMYLQMALNPVILFALSCDLRMYLGRMQRGWRRQMRPHNNRQNSQQRTMQLTLTNQPP